MMRLICCAAWVVGVLLMQGIGFAQNLLPQDLIFAGDGVKIIVKSAEETPTGEVSKGLIEFGGKQYPFVAKDTSETEYSGQFEAGGSKFDFTFGYDVKADIGMFKSGAKSYKVKLISPRPEQPQQPQQPQQPANPFDQPAPQPANPFEQPAPAAPAPGGNPPAWGAPPGAQPGPSAPAVNQPPMNNAGAQQPFGVQLEPWDDKGMWRISAVAPGSLAEKGGLKTGDVLLDGLVNGQAVPVTVDKGFDAIKNVVGQQRFGFVVLRETDQAEPVFQVQVDRTTGTARRAPMPPQGAPAGPGAMNLPEEGGQQAAGSGQQNADGRQQAAGNPLAQPPPVQPVARVITDGSRPAAGAVAQGRTPGRMVMKLFTFRDPGMENMESHTILLPTNLKAEGQVVWNPQSRWSYANLIALVSDPARSAELTFLPKLVFEYFQAPGATQQQNGQVVMGGAIWMPLPNGPEQLLTQIILPMLRQKATEVRFVGAEDYPKIAAAYEELFRPITEQQKQFEMQMQQMGGMTPKSSTTFHPQRARVAYTEKDKKIEEDFYFVVMVMQTFFVGDPSLGMPGMTTSNWSVIDFKSIRAPAGNLDAVTPEMTAVALSLRTTPKWGAVMAKLEMDLGKIDQKGIKDRADIYRKNATELAAMNEETRKSQDASNERIQERFVDYIQGVDKWKDDSGDNYKLTAGYDVTWKGSDGTIIQTNDHLFQPGVDIDNKVTWNQMERDR